MNTNNTNTTISLQLLILNDLLRSDVIDRELYDKASKKIFSFKGTTTDKNQAMMPVSA